MLGLRSLKMPWTRYIIIGLIRSSNMESRKPWGSILKWSSMTTGWFGVPLWLRKPPYFLFHTQRLFIIVTLAGLPEEERKWVTLGHPRSPSTNKAWLGSFWNPNQPSLASETLWDQPSSFLQVTVVLPSPRQTSTRALASRLPGIGPFWAPQKSLKSLSLEQYGPVLLRKTHIGAGLVCFY